MPTEYYKPPPSRPRSRVLNRQNRPCSPEVVDLPGGSANDYDYSGADPINRNDLNGQFWGDGWIQKTKNAIQKGADYLYDHIQLRRA
ncbi:MAG: hypothetical protein LBQ06_07630 [Frankiaceae bacterium]|jgi:hypothetical protein|nr:hypothetical protein [Frankiaceae bacterium]